MGRWSRRIVLVATTVLLLAAGSAHAADRFPRGFLGHGDGRLPVRGRRRRAHADRGSELRARDPANIAAGTVSGDQPESGPGFWQLFRDDLDLAANQLHNDAFRFSVEWPRIFPRSTESVDVGARIDQQELRRLDKLANQRAVRHYRRVLRAANRRGLTPFVTLQPLDDSELATRSDRDPRGARLAGAE